MAQRQRQIANLGVFVLNSGEFDNFLIIDTVRRLVEKMKIGFSEKGGFRKNFNKMSLVKTNSKPVIGIIGGTSQFGQWFKSFFENNDMKVLIAGRKTKLKPEKLAATADIVIVSVPLRATAGVIKKISKYMRPEALCRISLRLRKNP